MYRILSHRAWRFWILPSLLFLGMVGLTHSVYAHPGVPVTPGGFKTPFDPNRLVKITNGPGEGNHGENPGFEISEEAIDFVHVPIDYWQTVRAAHSGTVIFDANPGGGYGRTIIIQHNQNSLFSYYEHLDAGPPNLLNTFVTKGYAIGLEGDTGGVSEHLHFEVRNGVQTNPVVVNSGDSQEHSIIHTTKFFKRIGLFPWYGDNDMNSGFIPQSVSHPIGVCLSNRDLNMRWLPPSQFDHIDNSAGNADRFQGYAWVLDNVKTTIPPQNLEPGSATNYNKIFHGLADGNYWFHLRAFSNHFGWAPDISVSHIGPFKISGSCKSVAEPADWFADPEED